MHENASDNLPAVRLSAAVQKRIDAATLIFDGHGGSFDPDDRRDPRVAEFHLHARSETTRDAYLFFLAVYIDWCSRDGRREAPATSATLEAFARFLAREWTVRRGKNKGKVGMAPASIRLAISAVRTYHRLQGFDPPDAGLASDVVTGHARMRSKNPDFEDGKGAPPLMLPTLKELFAVCDPGTIAGIRDRAVLSVGWSIMARRSELARLGVGNVSRPSNKGITVYIARSKTDQLGEGAKVLLPYKPELGEMCPVTCAAAWQTVLGEHDITTGGFFRAVDKHERINGLAGWSGPKASEWMNPTTVERIIGRACERAMLAEHERYTAHSLRSGGATDFYLAGVDILRIARQGRWGDRSPVIFKYIRDAPDWERNALALAKFTI